MPFFVTCKKSTCHILLFELLKQKLLFQLNETIQDPDHESTDLYSAKENKLIFRKFILFDQVFMDVDLSFSISCS